MNRHDKMMYWFLGLAGGLAALVCLVFAVNALGADGGSRIYAVAFSMAIWVLGSAVVFLRPVFGSRMQLASAALLLLALLLRLTLFDYASNDYNAFLHEWVSTMRGMGMREALVTPIGDYNMPYLYVLLVISRLPFSELYCIKLFSVVGDVAVALAVLKLCRRITKNEVLLFLAFAAALLAPTMVLNSAYWGQCDSVYAALALWGLYCGLTKRPMRSMVLFALAFAFKLQTIFLLPIVAFLVIRDRVSLWQVLAFPVAFLASMLPALLAGRSFYDTFSIYWNQTNAYPYLSLKAPSLWGMIDNQYFETLQYASVVAAIAVTLLLFYLFLRKYRYLTLTRLLDISLLFTLAIPYLLPKMHERYFFLAEALSIVYAIAHPKRWPVCVILLLGGLVAYSGYLFGGIPVLNLPSLAVIYGCLAAYLTIRCLRDVQETEELVTARMRKKKPA